ncbi:MAG TPA: hypothetical protein VF390_02270 [Patescibacteria group bacterium]
MKKNEFVIDEEVDVSLVAYYGAMRRLADNHYPAEFARARKEQRERGGANFLVFGRSVALLEMLDGLIFFANQRPLDCRLELKIYLHERGRIKEIKYILKTLEDFLRELPGAKLPESRPKAMKELMEYDG